MNSKQRLSTLLIGLMLVLTVFGTGCGAAATPAPTAVPPAPTAMMAPPTAAIAAPTAMMASPTAVPAAMLDMNAVAAKYISSLPDGFSGIAPAALKDQLAASKPFLVDVREASESTTNGYIEGAVLIPIRTLTKNLDKLPAKDQPIVIYCAIGHRGAIAMETLQLLGYTNVKSLSGGFNAWKAANLPIANGTTPTPTAGKAPDVDKEMFAVLDK
jgi:rhodanese-related sulfurtransferase